ncbi:MAG: DNA internalization-related competence protein ComEC/Rec2, partial [Gammaproteobacteria bacterium]
MPLLIAAAFVAGICLLQTRESLPSWEWAPLFLISAFIPMFFRGKARVFALLFAVCGGGFWYASLRAEIRLAEKVPAALEWRDIVVEGTVRGFPVRDERRTRFDFDIEKSVVPPVSLRLRARLNDYHHGKSSAFLREGARLRIKVRIRPPRANFNPRGFDYAGYLFARGIRAAGYIRSRDETRVLSEGGGFRDSLRRRALSLPNGELISALVIGDRSQMDEEQWRVLRRTGVAHLFSISGTHIALAAGFAAFWGGLIWRRSRRLMRLMPAQKAALLSALPMVAGYAWLAGLGVPVQRGALMFFAAAAAMLGGGATGATNAAALAAVVVAAADPWAVTSPGFWLSFMLAGAVIAAASAGGGGGFLIRLLKLQLLVSLFAMPLTLWFFNEASLASPLANFIAVPLAGFIVLPLALLDVILPGDFLWIAAGFVLEWFWRFLEYVSASPFAARQTAAPWWLFATACAGGAWMLMPRGTPLRWTGVAPIVAILLWQTSSPPAGEFRMTALDVGQGAAVVVETQNRALVYDAGPPFAFRILDNFLRGRGRPLDMLIVSHDDIDHSGGAERLLRVRPPEMFLSSFPEDHPLRQSRLIRSESCAAGREWEWDGVRFRILHPPGGFESADDNAKSCVMQITAAGGSALLSGDIPKDAELRLARRYGANLRSEILLAP